MEVTAIVLAGGQSSRMGRDKAALELEGTTLLRRQFELARQVVGGAGEVRVSGDGRGLPAWADDDPGGGPLSGVATALSRMATGTWLLVLPIDMPLLEPRMLGLLRAVAVDSGWLVARFREQPMPFLIFNGPFVPSFVRKLARERASVRRLHAILPVREIDVPAGDEHRFFNANTPEDWRKLHGAATFE